MEEKEFNERTDRDEIFSKSVRAGKRTYFFDVKTTKGDELYLTITESKRRFNNDTGKFFYEKHKVFLYGEDFEKFLNGLNDTITYIKTGVKPESDPQPETGEVENTQEFTNVDFDELDGEKPAV